MNKTTDKGQIPQVCLLMKNGNEARDLALSFKQMGVHPFVVSDLNEWWAENSKKAIALTVADIGLCSSAHRFIAEHPLCQSGESLLSFYYSPETAPLLQSVANIFHLGLVQKSPFFEYQLRPILFRANQFYGQENRILEKQNQIAELEQKIIKNLEEQHQIFHAATYSKKVKEWTTLVSKLCGKFDFASALSKWAEGTKEVIQFGMLEISDNGQKLIARQFTESKYILIPSLWPGNNCSSGMDFMAQSLATQVAVEMFGTDVIPLYINDGQGSPKIALFLKTDKESGIHLAWKWFEDLLGLIWAKENYKKICFEGALKNISGFETKTRIISVFEYYGLLDRLLNAKEEEQKEWAHFYINLKFLEETIAEQKGSFSYHHFFKDFVQRIDAISSCDVFVTSLEEKAICLLLNKRGSKFSVEFEMLKDFSKKFPFYRYFENPDSLLAKSIDVEFCALPLSLRALKIKLGQEKTKTENVTKQGPGAYRRELNQ